MRTFWAIMAALLVGLGLLWLRTARSKGPAEPGVDQSLVDPAPAAPAAASQRVSEGWTSEPRALSASDLKGSGTQVAGSATPSGQVQESIAEDKGSLPARVDRVDARKVQPSIPEPQKAALPATAPAKPLSQGPDSDAQARAAESDRALAEQLQDSLSIDGSRLPKPPVQTLTPTSAVPAPAAAPAPAAPAAKTPATTATASATAKVEPQPDGSMLIDDKYVVKGKGTKDDPYRITWELLTSTEETYRPRLGFKNIPGRVKMLDGKWVRISGFVAFPIMAQSQDEMLMMLNQWDGCCIGVPPTPYDAIEVKLKKAASGDERMRSSGTITGLLKIDPYLVKDWLVSLYMMDDAEVSAEH